ncbi:MAG: nascent polypeptide-associated complex protein [Candidatus Bathyarchaeia archaeon]
MSPRDARRMMRQMGLKFDEVRGAYQVVIKTPHREIVIDDPEVAVMEAQGQRVYQVIGGVVSERGVKEGEVRIPEEDIRLVAQQANVTPVEAREALEETGGDLAQAILLLSSRRG